MMGIALKWDLTYRCFLRCKHCARADFLSDDQSGELTTDGIRALVPKLAAGGVSQIHLLGGEPTARRDLKDILTELMAAGIRVGYNTNGIRFDANMVRTLMANPLFHNIVFSIEGPTPEQNDVIRGKGIFRVAVRNIRRAVEIKRDVGSNCRITINMVVGKHNYRSLPPAIDWALELGVDELSFLQLAAEGNARELGMFLSTEELMLSLRDLGQKYTEDRGRIVQSNLRISPRFARPLARTYLKTVFGLDFPEYDHTCGASKTFGYLTPDGQLFPCDRLSPNGELPVQIDFGELKEYALLKHDFHDIWDRPVFHQTFQLVEGDETFTRYNPCFRCPHLKRECTPCPAYTLLGRELSEDACTYMLAALEAHEGGNGHV